MEHPLVELVEKEKQEVLTDKSGKRTTPTMIHNTDAFLPFSFGPGHCIGKQLAYREMRLVVASMVQKYKIRLEAGYDVKQWLVDMRDDAVFVKGKLPVVLKARF